MPHKLIALLIFAFYVFTAHAQEVFRGSFVMSFEFPSSQGKSEPPFLWNIDGSKMAMEIQDEMKNKGVSKRVLFDPADSSWVMSISYNKVKQATRIHAAAMFRDSITHELPVVKKTRLTKMISGYPCRLYKMESSLYSAECWFTGAIEFDIGNICKLLQHCGMMSAMVGKGDWFYREQKKGMILEVKSTSKKSGESYTMLISSLEQNAVNPALFSLDGFKISEIPEGQNCAPILEK